MTPADLANKVKLPAHVRKCDVSLWTSHNRLQETELCGLLADVECYHRAVDWDSVASLLSAAAGKRAQLEFGQELLRRLKERRP